MNKFYIVEQTVCDVTFVRVARGENEDSALNNDLAFPAEPLFVSIVKKGGSRHVSAYETSPDGLPSRFVPMTETTRQAEAMALSPADRRTLITSMRFFQKERNKFGVVDAAADAEITALIDRLAAPFANEALAHDLATVTGLLADSLKSAGQLSHVAHSRISRSERFIAGLDPADPAQVADLCILAQQIIDCVEAAGHYSDTAHAEIVIAQHLIRSLKAKP